MNRAAALAILALLALVTVAALVGPWWLLLAMTLAAFPLLAHGRGAYALFVGTSLAINAALLWLAFGSVEGAWRGFVGGLKLTAVLGGNLAVLSRVGGARLVDGLRLPPAATALLAAVVLSAHDVGADFRRLRSARLLEGAWPQRRLARVWGSARLLPPLMLAAHRRAKNRRDALRLAGHDVRPWFVPVVAVAALAAAGRLAFLALPNVALTYVVVFLGGLLFGPLAGAAGAALGMAVTDFLLTGFYPGGFVNVPAMALLGLAGGGLRRVGFDGPTRSDRVAGAAFAATAGVLGTFVFSAAADLLTWLLVAGAAPEALLPILLAGLAFNVVPALTNGVLFAVAVGPTVRAFRVAGEAPRSLRSTSDAPPRRRTPVRQGELIDSGGSPP